MPCRYVGVGGWQAGRPPFEIQIVTCQSQLAYIFIPSNETKNNANWVLGFVLPNGLLPPTTPRPPGCCVGFNLSIQRPSAGGFSVTAAADAAQLANFHFLEKLRTSGGSPARMIV